MINENVKYLLEKTSHLNPFGEKITLVAATKFVDVDRINESIRAGITDIGENKAQEFRDKFELVDKVNYHFFGRLQSNKVKYLIGKACLIQSVDSFELANTISELSIKSKLKTNILLEVNLGEEQKGGYKLESVIDFYKEVKKLEGIVIKGLMAVLPQEGTDDEKINLCLLIRKLYDTIKSEDNNFSILSIGMTHDYELAIKGGSNMVRIGEGIFGKRNY